jgi:hypothetical protein
MVDWWKEREVEGARVSACRTDDREQAEDYVRMRDHVNGSS